MFTSMRPFAKRKFPPSQLQDNTKFEPLISYCQIRIYFVFLYLSVAKHERLFSPAEINPIIQSLEY